MMRRVLAGLLVAGLGLSCGPKRPALQPVRGQVFFENRPAEGAQVVFHPVGSTDPQAPRPSGRVGADGSFTLSTFEPGDGAPAGDYEVAVAWIDPKAKANEATQEVPNRLPNRYSDPKTSGLKAQVKEGNNDIPAYRLTK